MIYPSPNDLGRVHTQSLTVQGTANYNNNKIGIGVIYIDMVYFCFNDYRVRLIKKLDRKKEPNF